MTIHDELEMGYSRNVTCAYRNRNPISLVMHNHMKVTEWLKYFILSLEILFGLNLFSKYYSEVQEFIKIYLFLKICSFPLRMKQ